MYRTLLLGAALMVFGAVFASGQNTLVLKVQGIDGEAGVKPYEKWIAISAFEQGTPFAAANSGVPAVSAQYLNPLFTVTKNVDRSSPMLCRSCAKGTPIPEVTMVSLKPQAHGGPSYCQYKITLKDAVIKSVVVKGGVSALTEVVAFNYSSVKWEYSGQPGAGSAGSTVASEYDPANPGP
jgi:type VI secretion system secreted protein Hcp